MENNYIDNMVRDAIGEYEMAFNPADWDAMEAQLEKDTRVRRKLYVAKGVEVCLMALAIWTTLQFVSIDNTAHYQSTTTQQETISPQPTENGNNIIPFQGQQSEQPNEDVENTMTPSTQPQELPEEWKDVPIANQQLNTPSVDEVNTNALQVVIQENNQTKQSVNKTLEQKFIPKSPNTNLFNTELTGPIASLETPMFDVNNDIMLFPVHAQVEYSRRKKHSNTRIGAFIATDLVGINTPNNVLVQKQPHQFNVSSGVVVDRKLWDKIRLETGGIFAFRKHSERQIELNFVGGTAVERREVATSVAEIPVHLLYDVYENKKNKVYAVAGVSNHFALSFNSELQSYDVYGGVQTTQLPTNRITADRGLLDESLNGEAVDVPSNHYVSINGGLGYERELNDKYSLFVQGVYKKGFGHLGRHDDNVSTVSLATGLKRKI